MRRFKWEILGKIKKEASIEDLVSCLLKNRGIKGKKKREEFFDPPKMEQIPLRKFDLGKRSVERGVERILEARGQGEEILIYGDYDADGICATAILWECLFGVGIKTHPYIPQRLNEGYGINAGVVSSLLTKYPKIKLVITVDNGVVAGEQIEEINGFGVDVIVTDHHQKGDKIPPAYEIIHSTKTSGAGVSYAFSAEIAKKMGEKAEGLDLAALGTVADQIPLIGINRSLVKYGLLALSDTHRVGLRALYEKAGIEGEIGTYSINYVIAPRINAMGRLGDGTDSLRLLCTRSESRARMLANLLDRTNTERQKVVEDVLEHARVNAQGNMSAVIVASEKYSEGVVGLAASKLVEEFCRPAIVFSKGEEISKASARSISGFNIIEAIREQSEILITGGGHPMAAGFSIKTDNLMRFTRKFLEVADSSLSEEDFVPRQTADVEIGFDLVDMDLWEILQKFNPTGVGNPRPRFVTCGVEVRDAKLVGRSSDHLKLVLGQEEREFEAIAFGMGGIYTDLTYGQKMDALYSIDVNEWKGKRSLQLVVKDLKLADK